jgi:hypothetical protein
MVIKIILFDIDHGGGTVVAVDITELGEVKRIPRITADYS